MFQSAGTLPVEGDTVELTVRPTWAPTPYLEGLQIPELAAQTTDLSSEIDANEAGIDALAPLADLAPIGDRAVRRRLVVCR